MCPPGAMQNCRHAPRHWPGWGSSHIEEVLRVQNPPLPPSAPALPLAPYSALVRYLHPALQSLPHSAPPAPPLAPFPALSHSWEPAPPAPPSGPSLSLRLAPLLPCVDPMLPLARPDAALQGVRLCKFLADRLHGLAGGQMHWEGLAGGGQMHLGGLAEGQMHLGGLAGWWGTGGCSYPGWRQRAGRQSSPETRMGAHSAKLCKAWEHLYVSHEAEAVTSSEHMQNFFASARCTPEHGRACWRKVRISICFIQKMHQLAFTSN